MNIIQETFLAEMHSNNRDITSRQAQKELAVLEWAVEGAKAERIPTICTNWASLDSAERWWLYRQGIANLYWRKAIQYALEI